MVSLVITTEGFERVIAVTDRLERPDWGALLDIIGATIEAQTIRHFQEQGGPEGGWEPRKDNYPWPILIKTGRLRGSITHERLGEDAVRVFTPVEYGFFHQVGTTTLPRRAFLGLSDADAMEVSTVVENYINDLVRE